MKVKDKKLIQLNITAVFESIDIENITSKRLKEVFSLKEDDEKNIMYLELPGLRNLIIPNRQKEIIFEVNRVKINERSGLLPEESGLDLDFKRIFENILDQKKLIAYGFNYDLLMNMVNEIDYKVFLGQKVLGIINKEILLEAGIRIRYEKEEKKYDFQIIPVFGNTKQLILTLNIHYDSNKINDYDLLKKQFVSGYEELQKLTKFLED